MLNSKTNFRFTDKRHPKDAKLATAIAVVAWLVFIFMVVVSIRSKGNVGHYIGMLGVADAFVTVIGTIMGMTSFRGEDTMPLFPAIATIANGLLLAVYILLFVIGVL